MPDYRRAYRPGGTFFFTVVTEGRADILCTELARSILRRAITACRNTRPFDPEAMILLPDHAHALWTLPPDDSDYSTRWAASSRSLRSTGWPPEVRNSAAPGRASAHGDAASGSAGFGST